MVGGGLTAAMFEAGHGRILKAPDLSSIASVPLLGQCRVTYYMVSRDGHPENGRHATVQAAKQKKNQAF